MSAAKSGAGAPFGAACAALVSSTMDEWYGAKHRRPSKEEIAFVNSVPVGRCPYCGCAGVTREGRREDGTSVFHCKACKRRFGPLTGTLFDSHKIPVSEWAGLYA